MDEIRSPNYTLRYHKTRVTVLKCLNLGDDYLTPHLFSGDDSGHIAIWDVVTRRPIIKYTVEGNAEIIAIQILHDDRVAILSKDHKLRIFNMEKDGHSPSDQRTQKAKKSSLNYRMEECYHVPVNTLNFANFLLQDLGNSTYRLICCNTQDSELVDIYTFHLSDLHSLKRLHKAVDFFKVVKRVIVDSKLSKVNKLGIVMKFSEKDNIIYCGFESGYIIGFRLRKKLCEEKMEEYSHDGTIDVIEVVYISGVHYPNPVLALYSGKEAVFSTSIDEVIGIHEAAIGNNHLETKLSSPNLIECALSEEKLKAGTDNKKEVLISEINHVLEIGSHLILSNWSGITIVVDENNVERFRFFKSKCNIIVNESPVGSLKQTREVSKEKTRLIKVSALGSIGKHLCAEASLNSLISIPSSGRKRRIQEFLDNDWCIIGYEDGSIAFHKL